MSGRGDPGVRSLQLDRLVLEGARQQRDMEQRHALLLQQVGGDGGVVRARGVGLKARGRG